MGRRRDTSVSVGVGPVRMYGFSPWAFIIGLLIGATVIGVCALYIRLFPPGPTDRPQPAPTVTVTGQWI